jgi:GNAT superfamily N-acetyltransferase
MATLELVREVEDALYRSWSARECFDYDGWQLRYADGFSRRANSVYPAERSEIPLAEKIEFCKKWYRERHHDLIVRQNPATESGLDDVLTNEGFSLEAVTDVMVGDLGNGRGEVPVESAPSSAWWNTTADLWGFDAATHSGWAAIIDRIDQPAGFACVGGQAAGFAVAVGPWVGLFEIIVAKSRRGTGLGRAVTNSLLDWGSAVGAQRAYLQVLGDNRNAIGFYRTLGFDRAYSYWYRRDRAM